MDRADTQAVGINTIASDIIRSYVGPRKKRPLRLELEKSQGVYVRVYEDEEGTKFHIHCFNEHPPTSKFIGAVSTQDSATEICLDHIHRLMFFRSLTVRNMDNDEEFVSLDLYDRDKMEHATRDVVKAKIYTYLELIRDTTIDLLI